MELKMRNYECGMRNTQCDTGLRPIPYSEFRIKQKQ